jgi:hypothetical protein
MPRCARVCGFALPVMKLAQDGQRLIQCIEALGELPHSAVGQAEIGKDHTFKCAILQASRNDESILECRRRSAKMPQAARFHSTPVQIFHLLLICRTSGARHHHLD